MIFFFAFELKIFRYEDVQKHVLQDDSASYLGKVLFSTS